MEESWNPPCFGKQGLCPHCYCWLKGAALCTHCGRASAALNKNHWERFPTDDGSQGQEETVGPVVTFWRSHILFAQILRVLPTQPILIKTFFFTLSDISHHDILYLNLHFPHKTDEVPKSKASLRDAYFGCLEFYKRIFYFGRYMIFKLLWTLQFPGTSTNLSLKDRLLHLPLLQCTKSGKTKWF